MTKNSLTEQLSLALTRGQHKGVELRAVIQTLGKHGFGMVLVLLALPSALPVPAPGYSTLLGLCIALISLQMLIGRTNIWLPQRILSVRLSAAICSKVLLGASRILNPVERMLMPRWQKVFRSKLIKGALACIIFSMAAMMMLPIPLTNTLPALVVFLLGIAIWTRDGVAAAVASLFAGTTLLLYGYLFILGHSFAHSLFGAVT